MNVNNSVPIITVDGPSGTGKGTISHMLARKLNWHVLDSGVLYRVLAYALRKHDLIQEENLEQVKDLLLRLNLHFEADLKFKTAVILDGEDIADKIRTEVCAQDASRIAAIPEIRKMLLARQREFAILPGLVADGRDMGTVVFPQAMLKFYLYASAKERAERRYTQLKEQGIESNFAEILMDLLKRDERDSTRAIAPLKPAEDAIQIDTTGLTIVQVFNSVIQLVDKQFGS